MLRFGSGYTVVAGVSLNIPAHWANSFFKSVQIMTDLAVSRQQILKRIENACTESRRPANTVRLLAVSKQQEAVQIRALYAAGQIAFGENYVQEALAKQAVLTDLAIEWHFIGQIQRNKTRDLAAHFDWVHSVDRLLIAERLSAQRSGDLKPLNLCIEVNIDGEDTKGGCLPEAVPGLVESMSRLPNVRLRGLMVIPAKTSSDGPDPFQRAQAVFEQVRSYHRVPEDWDTLSMGMSADLEQAIAAGATMVRVGTALFGARSAK